MEPPIFDNPVEEAKYWRETANEYRQRMEETREEFEDFQISSRELELELETQLEQLEKRNVELVRLSEKLTLEKETYRKRLENTEGFVNQEVTHLQEELEKDRVEKIKTRQYIRELEQINDDLERTQRSTVVTLEDFEFRLNQAIERNAFLENELDEKQDLMVTVQRLKDETRDLHQELALTKRHRDSKVTAIEEDNVDILPNMASNSNVRSFMVQTDIHCLNTAFLSPSVQMSALNMVNDALQKIGHLETKLSLLYRASGANSASTSPIQTNGDKILASDALPTHDSNKFFPQSLSQPYAAHSLSTFSRTSTHDQQQQQQQSPAVCRLLQSGWMNGSANLDYSKPDLTKCESPLKVLH